MAGIEQLQGMHLQQTLSPQMQQSLHILQLPLQELRQLVAQELAQNPVLEEVPPKEDEAFQPALNGELPQGELSENWQPFYEQQRLGSAEEAAEKHQFLMDSLSRPPGLREEVQSQLLLLELSPQEREIADAIVGNLDDRGFLAARDEEIAYQLGTTPLRVEEVLLRIQDFLEPPGLAARDLRDCLLIQLRRIGLGDSIEARIVRHHLEDIARRRHADVARKLRVSVEKVNAAVARIASLDPNPARNFSSSPPMDVIPEVIVEKEGEEFVIRLNRSEIPAIRIGTEYKELLSTPGPQSAETRSYLRDKLREGRFLLRSIEQRQETILAIAREIVSRQRDFMEKGPAYLRPMIMQSVAEAVGVHETTVSRAVSGKYMQTPHGVFEMKYFFTSGFKTRDGEEISNESVKRAIQELVNAEDPAKPLSDEQIVKALAEQGIPVARRTIAKYRDQLGILPSHLRKNLAPASAVGA